jgi:protein-S-isoprenylcysteine O-methyltransferase Ste14
MDKIIIFVVLSILVVIVSWRTLLNYKTHGFYRFVSWECIAWLISANYKFWFIDPFSINQLFSWFFLIVSIYLITVGVILMKRIGKPDKKRNKKTLYVFEQTTELVDKGIFKYLRHPLYSSLLFLTWGILLKHPTFGLSVVSLLSTIFLYFTAIYDEKECKIFFGNKYVDYMKRSKRFILYIF